MSDPAGDSSTPSVNVFRCAAKDRGERRGPPPGHPAANASASSTNTYVELVCQVQPTRAGLARWRSAEHNRTPHGAVGRATA